ncbi:MAG: PQQ-binding-like beta-propeller repeat protein [Nitrososphaerota archaeon]|nr:PQQ-binding-like beta-propeller repeat protein [Nitrososphaerota archaeon]
MPGKRTVASVAAGIVLLSVAATSLFSVESPATGPASTSAAAPGGLSLLYVADGADGKVSVVSTATSTVLWQIEVRADVREVALDTSGYGSFIYLTDVGGDNFITLDAQTGKIYGTYPSGEGTLSVTSFPPGGFVYVVASKDHSVSVVDSHDHKELNRDFLHTGTFHVGQVPLYAVFTPDLRFWYTDANTSTVGVASVSATVVAVAPWVVQTNVTTLAQIPMPSAPGHIAVADQGREVIAAVQDGLVVINASTYGEVARVRLPETPSGVVSSPRGDYVFAGGPGGVYVVDARRMSLETTIEMKGGAYGLALSPDGGTLYASNPSAGTVTVVDVDALQAVATVGTGGTPMGVCLYSGGGSDR